MKKISWEDNLKRKGWEKETQPGEAKETQSEKQNKREFGGFLGRRSSISKKNKKEGERIEVFGFEGAPFGEPQLKLARKIQGGGMH